jgi:hypothetical protein
VDGALLTRSPTPWRASGWRSMAKPRWRDRCLRNGRILLRIEIDSDLLRQIDCAAEDAGLLEQAWVLAAISAALAGRRDAGSAGPGDEQQAPVSLT